MLSSAEMVDMWSKLCREHPIVSVEDPMDEEDWHGWARLTGELGDRTQIVGDDLFVTNPERLKRGITTQSANAILVKVNQIGTLSETLQAISEGATGWIWCGFRIVQGKPKTVSLLIWLWRQMPDRLRQGPFHGLTGLPNITSCCGLPKNWTHPDYMRGAAFCATEGRPAANRGLNCRTLIKMRESRDSLLC